MNLNRTMNDAQIAKVFFQSSLEKDQLAVSFDELMDVRQILQNTPDLPAFFNNRAIEKEDKGKVLQDVTDGFSNLTKELIQEVYQLRLMGDLDSIIDEFEKLYDQHNQTIVAKVTTVVPLSDKQKEQLEEVFAEKIHAKRVIFQETIDPDIIGGVIIETGDQVYDGSIRSNLENIKKKIVFL
ncbi:ATP synthase F1 subunit delta [Pisciglobus halotolerans]|uniref:ATP synthase subunit delta n=1 Tax=Pisciglobus halotolerans TaxID=745365 RepID=A0A1I3C5M3_9LACT|nr:ATP synthase F1 subunit delta [Pisciglobus halotolerans]SFH69626.1 ATP synthase F1 subcomplex delta subunit [Pisciglobus halotolerans]